MTPAPTRFKVRILDTPLNNTLVVLPRLSSLLCPRVVVLKLNVKLAPLKVVVPEAVMVRTSCVPPLPTSKLPLIVLAVLLIVPVPVRVAPLFTVNVPVPVAEPVVLLTTNVPLVIVVPPL